ALSLLCTSCLSVQIFVVLLPSLPESLQTSLQLTNWLHQLANNGLSPSGKKTHTLIVRFSQFKFAYLNFLMSLQ
ncbi:MAG: hypothetical protein U9N85_10505, partial [Bacteroidota bacterium]|nr:hypothetical protein [Bacteroidota bacterium]